MVLCTSLVDFVATIKTDLNFCKIPSFLTPIETEEINRDWDGFGIQSCTTHCLCFLRVWCLSPIYRYPYYTLLHPEYSGWTRKMQRESMWSLLLHGGKGLLFVCLGFFSCGNTQSHTSGWTTYLWRPNGLKSGKDRRPCWPSSHPARLTDAAASTSSTAASTYTVAYRLHVCASRNLCTSVYQHSLGKCGTHYCSRLDCITQS